MPAVLPLLLLCHLLLSSSASLPAIAQSQAPAPAPAAPVGPPPYAAAQEEEAPAAPGPLPAPAAGSPSTPAPDPVVAPVPSIAAPEPLPASPAAAPSFLAASPAPAPSSEAPHPTNATEKLALLALRAEWQDPSQRLADWSASSDAPLCAWRGVTCTNFSVTSLVLSNLHLSGTLSPAIANLSSLSLLNLSHNRLSGRLPSELGSLPSLTSLFLDHNLFNSSIPSSLFLSSSLRLLHLEDNVLSGELPRTIANLQSLTNLSLQSNAFTGHIPSSITNLTKLSAFYAGSNRFNGIIPLHIGDLSNLVYLDLGGNRLTGTIPSSIVSLIRLKMLALDDNLLEGPLPPELGRLSSLETLDLCVNHLVGNIPASLGNLTMLKSLNLSQNNLSGEVPTNGVLAKFNGTSFAGNELLCGGNLVYPACITVGPAIAQRPGERVRHGLPYDKGTPKLGKDAKVTIAVLGGAFALVVVFVFLVCCSCRTSNDEPSIDRARRVERGRNSFSMDVVDSMRKAKLEIYNEGFTHNYEAIVSHAGYFDTAHVIGKGRFATVYRSDLPSGECFAVKVFNNPISQSTFEREMAQLHELGSHINTLLPIRGYYSNPIEKAIFYDFMPNGTLHNVLRSSPSLLDWSKRISIALGVSQALHQLHKGSPLKLLHKDLKSSNVLLDGDLKPLVADYGLTDLVSRSVVETPGYTPPEFTCPSLSVRRYTEKTDVYSFGVMLLELLTGKSPISHDKEKSTLSSQGKNPIPHQEQYNHISHLEEGSCASHENKSHVLDLEEELGTRIHLVTLVLGLNKEGKGLELLSPFVVETCPSVEHQVQAFELALLCIDEEPVQRPSMSEIMSSLARLA